MVASDTFHRLLTHHGFRVEIQGSTFCLYKGDQLLTSGTGADPLYRWMRTAYSFRLPDAEEIQVAKSLLKAKVERAVKKELKRRGREVKKDRARAAARYPWLKLP
jgi:hypothetical protein